MVVRAVRLTSVLQLVGLAARDVKQLQRIEVRILRD